MIILILIALFALADALAVFAIREGNRTDPYKTCTVDETVTS